VPPTVKKEARPEPKPEPRREVKPDARAEEKTEAKPAIKLEVRPVRKPADAESARAAAQLKEVDTPPPKPAAQAKNRTVVQVGAFSDAAKVYETRWKLERAGLKTYTQVIDTKEGKRTRIRVGPFETKAEAEKVSDKIRALDLPTAILTF
jgi:DedD protein